MLNISYTFPSDLPVTELRGITATGGRFTTFPKDSKMVDAVEFENIKVGGQTLFLYVAGRPELEALLEKHKAAKAAAEQALVEQYKAYALTERGQLDALVAAEQESYSENDFPGSEKWFDHKEAADALRAFLDAHPQLVAKLEAEKKAERKAYWDSISDFQKMGG